MPDSQTLATVAGIIGAFGAAMLVFRIQREVNMQGQGETTWLPWADRLLLLASVLSLFAAFLLVSGLVSEPSRTSLASASCTAAVLLVMGYVPTVLGHYRLLPGTSRSGPRHNPEPSERWLMWCALLVGVVSFFAVLRFGGTPATFDVGPMPRPVVVRLVLTTSYALVAVGSLAMIAFATRFPLSSRIRDLELAPERFWGLNGYQVWKYGWSGIVVGTLGQLFSAWLP